jgi:hypothetical protein
MLNIACALIPLPPLLTSPSGLDKALEARKKERALAKFRSNAGQADSHPPELSFAVEVQLAGCYAANKLWTEALDLYSTLVKNNKGLPLPTSRCGLCWPPVLLKQLAHGAVKPPYGACMHLTPPACLSGVADTAGAVDTALMS